MIYSYIGETPHHYYVYVDSAFTHKEPQGWLRATWFGLQSKPGRMWGFSVLLSSGAVYRNLPPHALSFAYDTGAWEAQDAQLWDCYSTDFAVIEYRYLAGARVRVHDLARRREHAGNYLFTVAPLGDGYSEQPENAKEFSFVRLDSGRLAIRPTNFILWDEDSITVPGDWPTGLKRQTERYTCE